MDLKGEYRIPAPRERVWAMLNDADVLRICIPGCESLEPEGDGFSARVTTRIGPVKATFNGTVALSNINPPQSYTISGDGKGGVAGFASGGADVNLAEDGGDTVLTYTADAKVGGKLAQLGSRLIDSTARKLADQFFAKFAEVASAPAEDPPAAPAEPAAPAAPAGPAPAAPVSERIEPTVTERVEPATPADRPVAAAAKPVATVKPVPPADVTEGLVGTASRNVEAVEEAVSNIAHDVADAAHHAEEALEKRAATGTLGGPWFWGLIVLAVIILFYLFAA